MHCKIRTLLGSVFLLLLCIGCESENKAPNADFEKHPIYQHYVFSSDKKVIDIGVPTPWATVSHIIEVMKRDEILRKDLARLGYRVNFYPFLKGQEINHFLHMGSLEGAIMGDVPTIRIAVDGRITVFSLFHKGSVSLVSRDIYRVRDLKNKKVAFPYGSIAHYYLLRLLQEKGLSWTDIRAVPMDTTDMLKAIEEKRIDALTTFEPTASVYAKMDPTLHTISRSFSSFGFFSMRKDYAAENRAAVLALLAAQFRAIAWLNESNRNVNSASSWVADESLKVMAVPLNKHILELNSLCAADLLSNIADYSLLVTRSVLGGDGEIRKEFELLRESGLVPQDREWVDFVRHYDADAVALVLKNMHPLVSQVRQ